MGAVFTSETDAEVIAHLIAYHGALGSLVESVRAACAELRGHYAFVAMSADHPGVLVGARRECPLVVGRGDGEQFIASAIPGFLGETRLVQYVGDGELVVVTPESVEFVTHDGQPVEHDAVEIDWDRSTAEKQGYETFMLKEIHEQDDAISDTLGERVVREVGVDLGDLGKVDDSFLRRLRRIVIVACGTAYHAGLVGRYAVEEWARLPVEVEIASEYRYRNPVLGPDDLVIGISQSGETADTLAAMRAGRDRGATVLAVTNIMGSQATRESDGVLYTRAGLEIGVAASKTFVAQLVVMYLLALRLAELRGTLPGWALREKVCELRRLPHAIAEVLERCVPAVRRIAEAHHKADFFLYLGRHVGLPIALEGALKLKEISYIATDAYAAGEMKHGPIALLDERTPVVAVATDSPVLEKLISNIEEVRVRGAHAIAIASEGDEVIERVADEVIHVPRTDWMIAPVLAVVPLQLLAYHIARLRGLNIDQPRNLAKTVTVE
jgi:glucosamine--fructose-6-phosphate aminotransferase (isomerizing)